LFFQQEPGDQAIQQELGLGLLTSENLVLVGLTKRLHAQLHGQGRERAS
jgi:hypothetical protein